MLDAARLTQQIAENRSRSSLDNDVVIMLALTRLIELIGEAASRVSEETRLQLTEIPWRNIIGMRNRVIHDYGNVNYDILWKTTTKNIPEMFEALEHILTAEPPQVDEE